MTQLFALVLTICSANNNCTDAVKDIYTTKVQCEREVYEKRYFYANCLPVEKNIRTGYLDKTNN
ncbi:DUF1482 family protein [Citrobacter sp. ANG330]|uniref:DUF1482 family protein n=1 Tax=Citrobacter sp. ANG330 TaxID=3048142 RepID=UPI0039C1DFF4